MRLLRKTFASVAVVATVIVWGLVIYWRVQSPAPFNPNVELVLSTGDSAVQLDIPKLLPKGDYVLEVYSTVKAKDWLDAQTGQRVTLSPPEHPEIRELTTPVMVYRRGFSEWTRLTIPPVLGKGAYTVVMHVNYSLNPIRRIEQSALIAVVIIK